MDFFAILWCFTLAVAYLAPLQKAPSNRAPPDYYIVSLRDDCTLETHLANIHAAREDVYFRDIKNLVRALHIYSGHFPPSVILKIRSDPCVTKVSPDYLTTPPEQVGKEAVGDEEDEEEPQLDEEGLSSMITKRGKIGWVKRTQRYAPWNLIMISLKNKINWQDLPKWSERTREDVYDYAQDPGKGVDIYVVDNEYDETNPDFADRASVFPVNGPMPYIDKNDGEFHGHGTKCAGVAVGSKYGVAKSANVTFTYAKRTSEVYDALYQILERHQDKLQDRQYWPEWRGSVISLSIAYYAQLPDLVMAWLTRELDRWGVIVVVVASNDRLNLDRCAGWELSESYPVSDSALITDSDEYLESESDLPGPKTPPSRTSKRAGLDPGVTMQYCKYNWCRAPGALCVGSVNRRYRRSSHSNYGAAINLWAPGRNIPVPASYDGSPGHSIVRGTSYTAPQVAGAAAIMLSYLYKSKPSVLEQSHWLKGILICNARRGYIEKLPGNSRNLLLNTGIHSRTDTYQDMPCRLDFDFNVVLDEIQTSAARLTLPVTPETAITSARSECLDKEDPRRVKTTSAERTLTQLLWDDRHYYSYNEEGKPEVLYPCIYNACFFLNNTEKTFIDDTRKLHAFALHIMLSCQEDNPAEGPTTGTTSMKGTTGGWIEVPEAGNLSLHRPA